VCRNQKWRIDVCWDINDGAGGVGAEPVVGVETRRRREANPLQRRGQRSRQLARPGCLLAAGPLQQLRIRSHDISGIRYPRESKRQERTNAGAFKRYLYCEYPSRKKWFVTTTKLGTTNKFFVAATKNFAAATKRFVDGSKHFVAVRKYFCCPYFNKQQN